MVLTALSDLNFAAFLTVLTENHTALHKTLGELNGCEVVLATELLEANDFVVCDTVDEHEDTGESLNLELGDEKWSFLSVESHEAALVVIANDFVDVHIDNLTSLEILMEERNDNIFSLSDKGKEFLFGDLSVSAVTEGSVGLCLLVLFFHLIKALFLKVSHDFF